MHNIDLSKVVKVYSGRPGCMCGCRGKWTYSSEENFHSCLGNSIKPDPEDVNIRAVKIIVGKVARNPDTKIEHSSYTIYYVETGSRVQAVYCKS